MTTEVPYRPLSLDQRTSPTSTDPTRGCRRACPRARSRRSSGPHAFRRVICFLPSFPQLPGGNPYPALIREVRRKPLRVFLQAGHRDLGWNEREDNWLAENLRVAAALAEADYDVRLVVGDGGHDPNHAGVLLPDARRWVFRSD